MAGRRVLILVEDDEHIAFGLLRLLGKMCLVLHAADVAGGLALVERGGYDLLLCDWELGLETSEPILELSFRLHPAARRLLWSSRGAQELREGLPASVVDGIYEKPLQLTELLAAISV